MVAVGGWALDGNPGWQWFVAVLGSTGAGGASGGDRGALLSRPVWRAFLGEGAGAFQEVI
jgi:hypothetical protein